MTSISGIEGLEEAGKFHSFSNSCFQQAISFQISLPHDFPNDFCWFKNGSYKSTSNPYKASLG